jgi:hypothetical protein
VKKFVFELLEHHGLPSPDDPELLNNAALERLVASFCQVNGWHPAESTVRRYVVEFVEEWVKSRK